MCEAGCACVLSASDKCQQEKRKTINGDDLLWAMSTLGFDKYVEPLKAYLAKYREVRAHGCDRHAAAADQPYASRAAAGVLTLCFGALVSWWLVAGGTVGEGRREAGRRWKQEEGGSGGGDGRPLAHARRTAAPTRVQHQHFRRGAPAKQPTHRLPLRRRASECVVWRQAGGVGRVGRCG